MTRKLLAVLSAVGVLVTIPGSILAHHSATSYEKGHPVTVTGTVTEYRFSNPHVQIHFDVKDENGNVEKWVAESGPPQRLYKAGWNAKTLKPGDQITVTGDPAKSNSRILSVVKVIGGNVPELTNGAE